MKRYKRDKLTAVTYGQNREGHEQIIDVNIYKDSNDRAVVKCEGEWRQVGFKPELGTWIFLHDLKHFTQSEQEKKPEPKTIKERTLTLIGKVEDFLDGKSKFSLEDLIREEIGIIKDIV